ncbi:MAG TPA: fibronectin type III domain-containing protein [Candidatus Krumholzibacteria bacterium]|nr:fibronectin type III domain-containing protein [Candidatus Krumholzibacteria bacterium]
MKAFRKHVMLAFATLALTAMLAGCADDTTAPIQQDEAPVLAPTNVQAEIVNGGDIRISWNPSTQINVRGYNVYRLDRNESAILRLTQSATTALSYTDGGAAYSHEYEYRVTSVSSKDTESNYASVVITNRTAVPNRKGQDPETQK